MELKEEVFNFVAKSIANTFGVAQEEITKDTNISDDYNAKSVNFVQIIGEIEDEYGYDLNFMKYRAKQTVGEQVDYVVETIAE